MEAAFVGLSILWDRSPSVVTRLLPSPTFDGSTDLSLSRFWLDHPSAVGFRLVAVDRFHSVREPRLYYYYSLALAK